MGVGMNILVGSTGFVGSNLNNSFPFDGLYNSKNIEEAFGIHPDLLVYAGVSAKKYMANQFPEQDRNMIDNAINNIKQINPKKLVLISTIDVYNVPYQVDEDTSIELVGLPSYGLHRYYLEQWVEENIEDYSIVRLPGLYGQKIKKNFIYDLIHIIPSMLKESKFMELKEKNSMIEQYYLAQDNGFYKCKYLSKEEEQRLKNYFIEIGFSALNFTDSRGSFQFYNLGYLCKHITIALENHMQKINLATEPVRIEELFEYINGKAFLNEVAKVIPKYDVRTKYATNFDGKKGYVFDKEFILQDIKNFVGGMGV